MFMSLEKGTTHHPTVLYTVGFQSPLKFGLARITLTVS